VLVAPQFLEGTVVVFEGCAEGPDRLPRVVIGDEEGRPLYEFGTDSPLRSTTGDFEQMALYAGEGAALVSGIRPPAEIIATMMQEAERTLTTLHASLGWERAQSAWPLGKKRAVFGELPIRVVRMTGPR
jgi:hypothetical protein